MTPILRSYTVFVNIPAGTTTAKIQFPDVPDLRDALIMGVEAYNVDFVTASTDNVTPVIAVADVPKCVLNFVQKSDRRGQDFPFQSLISAQYGGIYKEFDNWELNWQKCYAQFVAAPAATAFCLPLNFFYQYKWALAQQARRGRR